MLIVLRILTAHAHPHATIKFTTIGRWRGVAIERAFPGFNALGCLFGDPYFLLMDHFLNRFSTLSKKVKKMYRLVL